MSDTPRTVDSMDLGLLPRRCPICTRTARGVCADCAASLIPAGAIAPPPGLDACASLLRYEGPTTRLVAALKYRNHRDSVPDLGRALAHLVDPIGPVDAVTWAPTSPARRRERGYDQAELLARAVARSGGLLVRRLLVRRPGPAQTGRDRADRLLGPSFAARGRCPDAVLVVDDVRTTGATLSAAAGVLRTAGAARVVGLTLAVRP